MKKKLSFILLAIMLALLSVFCISCSDKDDGVLKVGMECGYQPYNWTQQDDTDGAVPIYGKDGLYANGYDVKIAKKLAESLGMKLEIHAYKWDSLIPSVRSGSLDLIIGRVLRVKSRRRCKKRRRVFERYENIRTFGGENRRSGGNFPRRSCGSDTERKTSDGSRGLSDDDYRVKL